MKLKVLIKNSSRNPIPTIIDKGDWVDLYTNLPNDIRCNKGESRKLDLGVAMKLPKGFEAEIRPRSSTFEKYGMILTNSCGTIDNSYNGNTDFWKVNMAKIVNNDSYISNGDRLVQFRITLSQKATVFQKLKWLFSSGIEFIEVDELEDKDRGGYGTTGK